MISTCLGKRDWNNGKGRVIGITECFLRDLPCLIPSDAVFVDEEPHQFRYGQRRMRVVQLDGEYLVKFRRGYIAH